MFSGLPDNFIKIRDICIDSAKMMAQPDITEFDKHQFCMDCAKAMLEVAGPGKSVNYIVPLEACHRFTPCTGGL